MFTTPKVGRNTYSFLRRSRREQKSLFGLFDLKVAIPIPSCEGQDASSTKQQTKAFCCVAIPIPSCEGQDTTQNGGGANAPSVAIPIPSCEGQDDNFSRVW